MAEELVIKIDDPFGNSIQFPSADAIARFIELEEEAWAWLQEAGHDPNDMFVGASAAFAQIRTWIEYLRTSQWNVHDLNSHLSGLYGTSKPALLLSDHAPGANVQLIRHHFDESEGEIAYALATNQSTLHPAENLRAARIWNMIACPALIGPNANVEEHRRRMGALRGAFQRALDEAEKEHQSRLIDHDQESKAAERRYRAIALRMARLGSKRADLIGQRARDAIDKIEATDRTFTLRMGLEAPVRYWRTKHRQHQWAWKVWGGAVILYLIVVGIAVGCAFPAIWNAIPVGQSLSGRHILLVTSIGAALTLIFWVARLLIRIFLGERHLATDAEERRVMTQAYLALMKAGAASNEERSIILASLFRGAQDGIVREEGAQDFTVPAMLAKLLDSRKGA